MTVAGEINLHSIFKKGGKKKVVKNLFAYFFYESLKIRDFVVNIEETYYLENCVIIFR